MNQPTPLTAAGRLDPTHMASPADEDELVVKEFPLSITEYHVREIPPGYYTVKVIEKNSSITFIKLVIAR